MTSDKTAIFGGIIILIGGLALAVYANTNATALSQAKANVVNKYISLSEKALSAGKTHDAEKYAIKAVSVDPSNKAAISALKKVVITGYAPTTNNCTPKPNTSPVNGTPTKVEKPANQPAKPAPTEEADEEMGCI